MGKTISFGIQKGGVGKTTTTAISAYLLSQEHRVLAVDFDSQGNLTQFLTGKDLFTTSLDARCFKRSRSKIRDHTSM